MHQLVFRPRLGFGRFVVDTPSSVPSSEGTWTRLHGTVLPALKPVIAYRLFLDEPFVTLFVSSDDLVNMVAVARPPSVAVTWEALDLMQLSGIRALFERGHTAKTHGNLLRFGELRLDVGVTGYRQLGLSVFSDRWLGVGVPASGEVSSVSEFDRWRMHDAEWRSVRG